MGRHAATFVVLFVFWLALSGHYSVFLICVGALSSLAVVAFLSALKVIDRQGQPYDLAWRGLAYWPWLVKEILVSAWSVSKAVLHPSPPASLAMRRVRASQKTPRGQNIYANSITLTPGTLTVELEGDTLLVHALQASSLDDLDQGEMDARVRHLEGA